MLKYLLPSLLLLANAIYPLKAGDLPLKIADIDPVVGVELETAIRSGWESSLVISPKFEKAMIALTGSAVFNGEKPNSIVKVLKRFYALLQKGAPEAEALSLADMAFSDRISDDQWLNGAIALKKGTAANLPEAVLVEVVSHAINEKWTGSMITAAVDGLIAAKRNDLNVAKVAIAVVIRFDQGLGSLAPETAVNEEIKSIGTLKLYDVLDLIIKGGVNRFIAKEIYQLGITNNWNTEDLKAVLQGLKKAHDKGLSVEQAATAMVVRVEQGLNGIPAVKMVDEELAYVASLATQQKRLEIIKKESAVADQLKTPVIPTKEVNARLNADLLRQSIESFRKIPTPYLWGGTTTSGVDCSGFVQACYQEQGIQLPRVSATQYQFLVDAGRTVTSDNLKFGDLVFFDTMGYGRVTHVGIYYGDGKFAHSCSSKGVTVTNLKDRYFSRRYTGAGRVV